MQEFFRVLNFKSLLVALILFLLSFSSVAAFSLAATSSNIPNSINPVNPSSIPLGDGNLSTSPEVGSIYSCQTSFNGGGAQSVEPWINETANTWNSTAKPSVEGNVSWPNAFLTVQISGNQRIISGNDEPINHGTGIFPIAPSDPAYRYDKNPNYITAQQFKLTLPANPTPSNVRTCVPMGQIGVLTDGVFLFNGLDASGRDAAVHEVLDSCGGHPDSSGIYHHHEVPPCILNNATEPNTSTLVGYAIDGYGIYVERDSSGNLLTNSNLDVCHGRTSEVMWDGKLTMMYHYDATLEYPYTVGCFVGTPHPASFTGPINSSVTVTTNLSTTTSFTSTTLTSTSTASSNTTSSTLPSTTESSNATTHQSTTTSSLSSVSSKISTTGSSSSSATQATQSTSSISNSIAVVVVAIVVPGVLVVYFAARRKSERG